MISSCRADPWPPAGKTADRYRAVIWPSAGSFSWPLSGEGVQEVTTHLQRFTGGGALQVPEQGMLDRLRSIAAGDMEPASYDLNFYTHELDEADRYAQLGFGPGSGVDLGSSEMYEVWNDVHTAALEDYGISDRNLFHPRLAP
jgi:hypothetical protein